MKISIFTTHKKDTQDIVKAIELQCDKYGYEISDNEPDVVIYIGGDGTFLSAIQNNIDRLDDIYLLGIHAKKENTLGHFYDFGPEDIDHLFPLENNSRLYVDSLPLLEGTLYEKEGNVLLTFYALNEIKISSLNSIIKPNIYINDRLFENYAGSGMCFATPCGSSGLNKSLNGPVLGANVKAMVITPIAPLNSSVYKSLTCSYIASSDDEITLNHINDANICFDNVILEEKGEAIKIISSSLAARVLFDENRLDGLDKIRKSFDL